MINKKQTTIINEEIIEKVIIIMKVSSKSFCKNILELSIHKKKEIVIKLTKSINEREII